MQTIEKEESIPNVYLNAFVNFIMFLFLCLFLALTLKILFPIINEFGCSVVNYMLNIVTRNGPLKISAFHSFVPSLLYICAHLYE